MIFSFSNPETARALSQIFYQFFAPESNQSQEPGLLFAPLINDENGACIGVVPDETVMAVHWKPEKAQFIQQIQASITEVPAEQWSIFQAELEANTHVVFSEVCPPALRAITITKEAALELGFVF
jgi:hypothetical protein